MNNIYTHQHGQYLQPNDDSLLVANTKAHESHTHHSLDSVFKSRAGSHL